MRPQLRIYNTASLKNRKSPSPAKTLAKAEPKLAPLLAAIGASPEHRGCVVVLGSPCTTRAGPGTVGRKASPVRTGVSVMGEPPTSEAEVSLAVVF